jgi:hypothetical protein
MAERGSRTPASSRTAGENIARLSHEPDTPFMDAMERITTKLRKELEDKGLRGFKRGGRVKKTGVAKVHRGERVLTKKQAAKPAVKKAVRKPVARKPAVRRKR